MSFLLMINRIKVQQISTPQADHPALSITESSIQSINEDITSKQTNIESYDCTNRLYISKDQILSKLIRYQEIKENKELEEYVGSPLINKQSHNLTKIQTLAIKKKMNQCKDKRIKMILNERDEKDKEAMKSWKLSPGSIEYLKKQGRLNSNKRIEILLIQKGNE